MNIDTTKKIIVTREELYSIVLDAAKQQGLEQIPINDFEFFYNPQSQKQEVHFLVKAKQ